MPLGSGSDLVFMLQDAGEAVVYNGVSSFGILEHADAIENTDGGMVQVRAITLLVATSDFLDRDDNTTLRTGGRITVAGKPYRVDQVSPEDDGEVTRLRLAKAS